MTVVLKLTQGREMMNRMRAASRSYGSARDAALAAMAEDARAAIRRKLEGGVISGVIAEVVRRKLPDLPDNNDREVAASLRVKRAGENDYGVTARISEDLGEPRKLREAIATGTRFIGVRAGEALLKPLRG